MNRIRSMRVLAGQNQKEMAKALNLSEGHYRAKEKGRYQFTQEEMFLFLKEVHKVDKTVTLEMIFFNQTPT